MGHEITLLCANRGTGNDCPPIRLIELPPDDDPVTVAAESARRSIPSAPRDATLHRELGKLACDRGLAARVLASLDEAGLQPDAIYERYALFHRADRKSTRLNSSHRCISYAVFCLKKKKKKNTNQS